MLYSPFTVTRLDVIFRYPDRVPLTHFVHRAKQVFAMWAWIFCWVLCASGIFRRCNGKVIWHRMGANPLPSDYCMNQVFYHWATEALYVRRKDIHSLPLQVFSGRFCSYRKLNFPAISGSYLPGFSAVSAVTGSRIFRPYQVVTCRDFLAVSAVTGIRIFRPYL